MQAFGGGFVKGAGGAYLIGNGGYESGQGSRSGPCWMQADGTVVNEFPVFDGPKLDRERRPANYSCAASTWFVPPDGAVGYWFAGRVWTFDYPAGRLVLRPAGNLPPHGPGQRVELGFGADSTGARTTHFPRIRVRVDGDSLDFLFDTGATMVLTDSALARIGDGRPARRAASFISATVLDRWRQAHPDWRVIERATGFGADLIEVPAVEIAGRRVGRTWACIMMGI